MTYNDLCKNVLLRMGEDKSIVNGEIVSNSTVQSYLKTIPALLQDALVICSTAGKYVNKYFDIINNPPQNLLRVVGIIPSAGEDKEYTETGKAYYFEMSGSGTAEIYLDGEPLRTVENSEIDFTAYKGLANGEIRILFKGLYPYMFRNVAIYGVSYPTAEDVFEWVPNKRYDFKTLVSDFYKLNNGDMSFSGETITYEKTKDYYWESTDTLLLDNLKVGWWRVHYFAYPQTIADDISPTTILSLDPDVYAIIPLYIEGKLRMINDEDYSSTILSEFEQKRNELFSRNFPKVTATVNVSNFDMLMG